MNGHQHGRMATIHQFPTGGRGGSVTARQLAPTVIRPARFAPTIIAESGWYHDEAMREEEAQVSERCKPN